MDVSVEEVVVEDIKIVPRFKKFSKYRMARAQRNPSMPYTFILRDRNKSIYFTISKWARLCPSYLVSVCPCMPLVSATALPRLSFRELKIGNLVILNEN
jgi:hypothetical protein